MSFLLTLIQAAGLGCASAAAGRRVMHYLQLESYQLPGYIKSVKRNAMRALIPPIAMAAVGVAALKVSGLFGLALLLEALTAALLEKMGLRRGNGSMRGLLEPARRRFGDDYASALEEAIRLNDLALFSSHALTQAQRASALKFYADTQGSLKKNVKWYHRVWIKWIQCLY